MTWPNKASAGNGAVAFWFHAVALRRAVPASRTMRILIHLLALVSVTLCSCERSPKVKLVVGDDPTWISAEETRRLGERLITERYSQAQVVSELGAGQTFTYRFATNGTALPVSVVVDRKTGKARFETSSR